MVSKPLQEGSDSDWDDGSVSLVGDELELQHQSAAHLSFNLRTGVGLGHGLKLGLGLGLGLGLTLVIGSNNFPSQIYQVGLQSDVINSVMMKVQFALIPMSLL